MISAKHPYANAMGAYPMGRSANGWAMGGRFSDFDVSEEDNGSFLFSWEIDSISDSAWVILIFKDGAFHRATREVSWVFVPDIGRDRWSFEFVVVPVLWFGYTDNTFFLEDNLLDQLKLTYDIDGAVEKVEIVKNTVVGGAVDYSNPVKTYKKVVITIEGTDDAFLAGTWPKQATKFAEITVTIDFTGGVDVAQFHWEWGSLTSDTFIVRSYAQDINLNGLRLSFDSDATWTEGETFTIKVQMREVYESPELANGLHTYAVVTRNKALLANFSDEASKTLAAIPAASTVNDSLISYVDGSGEVKVYWTMPADVDVDTVYMYRNYPDDFEGADNVNFPFHKETISPGQIFSHTVKNLQPGLNRIWARAAGNGGEEFNFLSGRYELHLDASLNEQTVPGPPVDFTVELQSDLTVTITVTADDTSDTLNVYHDNETGTVDYSTVYTTIANPQTEDIAELTKTGLYLPDGTYQFGVRAQSGTVEETNTDTKEITIDTTLPPKATSLALEAV